jgi:predicted metal-dependent phosphoesterase TrpH
MSRVAAADARVDLHVHTTCSDGAYTPAQVVDLARRAGLPALAITDHDTLEGLPAARTAAAGHLEIVPAVEITCELDQREFHLLAYFVRPEDRNLAAALEQLRRRRAERFREMIDQLRPLGIHLEAPAVERVLTRSVVGRRQLAELLVEGRHVSTVRQAFARYLGDDGEIAIPPVRLPVPEAIALVRGAGGVAAMAHPAYDCTQQLLARLQWQGLGAVEVNYPGFRPGRVRQLRAWAAKLALAVTGGSDCHGPGPAHRGVGARGITWAELEQLRQLASG